MLRGSWTGSRPQGSERPKTTSSRAASLAPNTASSAAAAALISGMTAGRSSWMATTVGTTASNRSISASRPASKSSGPAWKNDSKRPGRCSYGAESRSIARSACPGSVTTSA